MIRRKSCLEMSWEKGDIMIKNYLFVLIRNVLEICLLLIRMNSSGKSLGKNVRISHYFLQPLT